MILRDFQIWLGEGEPVINRAAFPIAEAVRLDLVTRRPRAPFVKICLTMRGEPVAARSVFTSSGICECFLQVDCEAIAADLPSTRLLVDVARRGLQSIEEHTGFRDPAIEAVLEPCADRSPPCQHRVARLTRTSRSGLRCETWVLMDAARAAAVVRIFDGDREVLREDVLVVDPPWGLRDEWAVKQARFAGDRYVLIDRAGGVQAAVRLPSKTA